MVIHTPPSICSWLRKVNLWLPIFDAELISDEYYGSQMGGVYPGSWVTQRTSARVCSDRAKSFRGEYAMKESGSKRPEGGVPHPTLGIRCDVPVSNAGTRESPAMNDELRRTR
jgi:hypothetical protein